MTRYHIFILTISGILLALNLEDAIAGTVFSKDSVSGDFNEKLCLLTDRNLYAAGEKVFFSARILNSPSSGEYNWSGVMYLELISSSGNPVVQTKHPVKDLKAEGYLLLPENILTGSYYLKAYTRWMRNFSSSSYAWVHIRIINPFLKGIENADGMSENKTEDNYIPVGQDVLKNGISCQTDKSVYHHRDKVKLSLAVNAGFHDYPGDYCIAVIRSEAIDTVRYGIQHLSAGNNRKDVPLKYLPDIRGLSLSGRIVDQSTIRGIPRVHVKLSVLGNYTDYSSYITRDDGRFIFALEPYHGTTDMYITAESKENPTLEILFDNEYANDNMVFFRQPFSISDREKIAATEMILNFQIQKAYSEDIQVSSEENDKSKHRFFYDNHSSTIYIDDYIQLPTIGEVIFELIPQVSVIKRNDSYYLRSGGYFTDLEIYRPLIFIDNIPVADIGALLKMSPERIERIDVVDRIYAKGDLLFGGILNMISRKGDMAGIDLPENYYFFDFEGFFQPDTMTLPGCKNQASDPRIPDVRNCLYWNPSVRIFQGNTSEIEFYTSDRTGSYLIIVRGVTGEGEIVEGRTVLMVAGPDSLNTADD
ncbi:MAG: hypothetical protein JW723_11050 [Bacteroidales bacterium]|nr:hypothetical protein [Bacteroidales bacterium]